MDLLESGSDRAGPPPAQRIGSLVASPPPWLLTALAVAAVLTVVAGLLVAADVRGERARDAARVDVAVRAFGASSSTVGGVARGRFSVAVTNRDDRPVRLGALRVAVDGLQVAGVEPSFDARLGPREERLFRVVYLVPDCGSLALPGLLRTSFLAESGDLVRIDLPVVAPGQPRPGPAAVALGACRGTSADVEPGTATDVAARPAGGGSLPQGDGAVGVARVEVRNAGAPIRLLAVDARVPGVSFTARVLEPGRSIGRDGAVVIRLPFRIEDCASLQPSGWLRLRLERFGDVQEVGLRLTAEPAARLGPQLRLPVVFDACP